MTFLRDDGMVDVYPAEEDDFGSGESAFLSLHVPDKVDLTPTKVDVLSDVVGLGLFAHSVAFLKSGDFAVWKRPTSETGSGSFGVATTIIPASKVRSLLNGRTIVSFQGGVAFLSDGTVDTSLFELFNEPTASLDKIQRSEWRIKTRAFWDGIFQRLPKLPVRAADSYFVVLENGDLYSIEQMSKPGNPKPEVFLSDVVTFSGQIALRKDGTAWWLFEKPEQIPGVTNVKTVGAFRSSDLRSFWLLRDDGRLYRRTNRGEQFELVPTVSGAADVQVTGGGAYVVLSNGNMLSCRGDFEDRCKPYVGLQPVVMPGSRPQASESVKAANQAAARKILERERPLIFPQPNPYKIPAKGAQLTVDPGLLDPELHYDPYSYTVVEPAFHVQSITESGNNDEIRFYPKFGMTREGDIYVAKSDAAGNFTLFKNDQRIQPPDPAKPFAIFEAEPFTGRPPLPANASSNADGGGLKWVDHASTAPPGQWSNLREFLDWKDGGLVDGAGKLVIPETVLLGQHTLKGPKCCNGDASPKNLIKSVPEFQVSSIYGAGLTGGKLRKYVVSPGGIAFYGDVEPHSVARYQSAVSVDRYTLSTHEMGGGKERSLYIGLFSPTSPILYPGQWFPGLGWVDWVSFGFNRKDPFYMDDKGRILVFARFQLEHDLSKHIWLLLLITPKGTVAHPLQPAAPTMVDPVTIPTASSPVAKVLKEESELVKVGRKVDGIAADGVARTVIYIPTSKAGERVKVEICANSGNLKTCGTQNADEYGILAPLGDLSSDLTKTNMRLQSFESQESSAVSGETDPYAFVVYRAPLDFARKAPSKTATGASANCPAGYDIDDCNVSSRSVWLHFTYPGKVENWREVKIVRPPVVLVHGYTSEPASWDAFRPITGSPSVFQILRVDYSDELQAIDIDPYNYPTPRANVIGVDWNEQRLFPSLVEAIAQIKQGVAPSPSSHITLDRMLGFGAFASVQVDIIGHSMGGLIAKAVWEDERYLAESNFNRGYFHKLITLGTPFLGSHYALHLMDGTNQCVRDGVAQLTQFRHLPTDPITRVVLAKPDGQWSPDNWVGGAADDLVGNGTMERASPTLQQLHSFSQTRPQLPQALLAGVALPVQYYSIDHGGGWLKRHGLSAKGASSNCSGDFLAKAFSSTGWPTIFGTEFKHNDGFVSVNSALDGLQPGSPGTLGAPGTKLIEGAVHGLGTIEDIGIGKSGESLQEHKEARAYTQLLLNTSATDDRAFHFLGAK